MLKVNPKLIFLLAVSWLTNSVTQATTIGAPAPSFLPLQIVEQNRGLPFPKTAGGGAVPFKNQFKNLKKAAPLPSAVVPSHYTLFIRPILNDDDVPQVEKFTAPGSILIGLNCTETTSHVTLHKDPNLVIFEDSIQLFGINGGDEVVVSSVSFDVADEFYRINFDTSLQATGQYELSMDFVAEVNDGKSGLYRAKYDTPGGETKWMATTQFQSYGARKAFPCFDEPGLKATFNISIGRKVEMNSLSNTDQIITGGTGPLLPALPPGWVWDVYRQSVPMSTYLVAMIVSEFTCLSANETIFPGTPVRVCGPAHQILDQGGATVPVETAARTMQFLESTFKVPYEMFKLDNAAIPWEHFSPGGMENYGLITYKDNRVLYYEGESTEAHRIGVVSLEFHEMGHLWFGDLITCKTWAHVWLNEGFATYVSTLLEAVAPEFDSHREILWEKTHLALDYDVGVNEPIYNENEDSDYDIIYLKGASLIRMMEGFLGKDVLIDALAEYLRRHAYQPVVQDQLFEVLNEYARANDKIPETITMKEIMDTWTLQPGYPLVRVTKVNTNELNISQEIYLPTSSASTVKNNILDQFWQVPVAMVTDQDSPDFGNHTPAFWMDKDVPSMSLVHDTTKWIIINPDATAFYRVLYDDAMLTLIHDQLATDLTKISGLSRAQLIDDYFSFAKLGHVTVDKPLDLTKYLANDHDHVVWYTVMSNLDQTRTMFEKDGSFGAYLMPKIEKVLEFLLIDWADPSTPEVIGSKMIFTSKMLDWACALGSTKYREFAAALFQMWMNDEIEGEGGNLNTFIPPDFAAIVFCHGVAAGGQPAFDFLINQFATASVYGERRSRFLKGLACARDATLQNFLYDKVLQLSGENCLSNCLTQSDAISSLQWVTENPNGRALVVTAVEENLDKIKKDLGESAVAGVAMTLSKFYNTVTEQDQLTVFVELLRPALPSQSSTLDQALTNVQKNVQWMTETGQTMKQWFESSAKNNYTTHKLN